ncbi:MAG: trigger factor [Clostridiales bacterium]|nr:trigger factor [Clostridiales bacterium]
MSSTFEKLTSNKVKLNFVVSAEDFDKALATAYSKNVKRFNIPGFRRGKAPRHVIEMHYGPSVFFEDAFDEIFPVVYSEAIKEHSVEPVDRPELDVTQIEKGKDLIFSVEVFVRPDVVLGDYKNLEAKKVVDEVTDDDVSAEIERARDRNSRFVEVTDRPARLDDQVNIDYAGFDGDNQFAGGTAKGQELVLGSGHFIPGFEDQLVGATVGQDVDVNVTFPEEYHEKSLAGKPVVFHVHVNGIREKEVPALDDEFAKDMGFDTLDEYKADVKANLIKRNEERAETAFENEVVEKAVATCEMDIPNGMVEEAIDNMLRDMEMRLMYQGMKLDDYFKYTGQTREQVREMYREQAAERVKTQLALEAIRDAEKIEATEEEIDAEIAKLADSRKKSLEDMKKQLTDGDKEYFKQAATMNKVVEFLKGCAHE